MSTKCFVKVLKYPSGWGPRAAHCKTQSFWDYPCGTHLQGTLILANLQELHHAALIWRPTSYLADDGPDLHAQGLLGASPEKQLPSSDMAYSIKNNQYTLWPIKLIHRAI